MDYEAVYNEVYKTNEGYGTGFCTPIEDMIVKKYKGKAPKVLDVGCGHGKFLPKLHKRLPKARLYGLDVHVPDEIPDWMTFIHGVAWEPSPDFTEYDVIVSFDFLEHLMPCDIERTLMAWNEALVHGGDILSRICPVPGCVKPPEGLDNLHCTVKPIWWWLAQFREIFPNSRDIPGDIIITKKV